MADTLGSVGVRVLLIFQEPPPNTIAEPLRGILSGIIALEQVRVAVVRPVGGGFHLRARHLERGAAAAAERGGAHAPRALLRRARARARAPRGAPLPPPPPLKHQASPNRTRRLREGRGADTPRSPPTSPDVCARAR
eukprot:180255-Prorocentrum_minimum.AAC.2